MKSSTTRTEGFLTIMRHHGALRITVTAPVQLQYPLSRPDCVGIADVRRSECSFHNNRRPGSALFFVVLLTVLFVGDDLVAVRADLPLAGIARRRLTTLVSVEREGREQALEIGAAACRTARRVAAADQRFELVIATPAVEVV